MKGDPAIIRTLNSVRTNELTAVNQHFLHARCVRDRSLYVMRFAAQPKASFSRHELENYYGVAAHLVEQFDHEATHKLRGPSFSASQLHNSPPCPSCGNSLWCFCSCGRIHCAPRPEGDSMTLDCPWCDSTVTYTYGEGDFAVGGGAG